MSRAYTAKEIKFLMRRVLEEYLKCGVIGYACSEAGVSLPRHREWLEKYPRYKELYEEIKEKFIDGLEVEAMRRAKEKSDSLMTLMLKSHRREIYGDKSDVNLKTNQPAPITLMFAEGMLTEEERKILQAPVEEETGSDE